MILRASSVRNGPRRLCLSLRRTALKRFAYLAVSAFIVTSVLCVPMQASATPFNDVPANSWAADYIQTLAADGILAGYPNGKFLGNRPMTRNEVAVALARAIVRGLDPEWVRKVYGFALKPDAVFYLRIGVDDLIPRVVFSRGFDYWETGNDVY